MYIRSLYSRDPFNTLSTMGLLSVLDISIVGLFFLCVSIPWDVSGMI